MADAPKVYAAISAVQKELAETGIAKEGKNTHFGYNFRGIDQVYEVIAPLLHKHGLLILPVISYNNVEQHEDDKGKLITHVYLNAEYEFISVEDGSSHRASVVGEAMDTGGDKASNKALSAAYKYGMIQAFAIPVVGEDDADQHSPQAQGASHQYENRPASEKQVKFISDLIGKVNDPHAKTDWEVWLGDGSTITNRQAKEAIEKLKG